MILYSCRSLSIHTWFLWWRYSDYHFLFTLIRIDDVKRLDTVISSINRDLVLEVGEI